jgi:hypothetical protein
MLKHLSFALATIIASATVTVAPAFADGNRAPVAMSGARHPDREVPAVEHSQDRGKVAPTTSDTATRTAPVVQPVVAKVGFVNGPVNRDNLAGFNVRISDEDRSGRFGFHSGGAPTAEHVKIGFTSF